MKADRSMVAVLVAAYLASACSASKHYESVDAGRKAKLEGSVVVEWMGPDKFLFVPKAGNELRFIRSTGEEIQPKKMFTDGGSVPRPFWILKNYSPWGYGPAFVIHDWLFHMQDCKIDGWETWTIEEAALVMSEVMKVMMLTPGFDFGDKSTVYLMYRAVQTAPARESWADGRCTEQRDLADNWMPEGRVEISFDSAADRKGGSPPVAQPGR